MNDIAALRSGATLLSSEVQDLRQDHVQTVNRYTALAELLERIDSAKQGQHDDLEAQYPTSFKPDFTDRNAIIPSAGAVSKGAREIVSQQQLVHECQQVLQALAQEELEHGERLARVGDRLDEALALVRPQHTPTLSDASRLRDCLGEVQDEMAVMADRHVAMQQANELLADLIGKLKAEPPEVPQATPRQTQVLHMRAEGAIQIPGSPGSHSPSSFSVPTQHQVSGRIQGGLRPGSTLGSDAIVSADDGRNQVVCSNVVRISASDLANPQRLGQVLDSLTTRASRGCHAVAAERQGETGFPGAKTVSDRLFKTAILVIDPKKLDDADQLEVASLLGNPTLSTECSTREVPKSAIVAAIVPARTGGDVGVPTLQVGDRQAAFSMTVKDGGGQYQTQVFDDLTMPDYEQGLTAVLQANPDLTLLIHLTRFQ